MGEKSNLKKRFTECRLFSGKLTKENVKNFFIDNMLYILLLAAIVGIQIYQPRFLSLSSVVNILSLSAANLPIALGIAGCIILTGTDLSAGRIVGLTACVAASLLQATGYANKMFPLLPRFRSGPFLS